MNDKDPSLVDKIMYAGDIFGEVNLVCSLPRRVTIRAKTHVDLFSLSKADFEDVLQYYPDIKSEVAIQSKERFGHMMIKDKLANSKRTTTFNM